MTVGEVTCSQNHQITQRVKKLQWRFLLNHTTDLTKVCFKRQNFTVVLEQNQVRKPTQFAFVRPYAFTCSSDDLF